MRGPIVSRPEMEMKGYPIQMRSLPLSLSSFFIVDRIRRGNLRRILSFIIPRNVGALLVEGDPATRLIVPFSSYWTRGATFNQLCCDTHNAQCLWGKEREPRRPRLYLTGRIRKMGERWKCKTALLIPHTPVRNRERISNR